MDLQSATSFIDRQGFAVFVAVILLLLLAPLVRWLMTRLDKRIDKIIEMQGDQYKVLAALADGMERSQRELGELTGRHRAVSAGELPPLPVHDPATGKVTR